MIFLLVVLFLNFAVAQENAQTDAQTAAQATAMTDAALALVQLSSFVDANVTFCAQHAPQAGCERGGGELVQLERLNGFR